MEQELIQKKVEQVFIRVFGPGTVVTPDTPAGEINGWDSMNHVILIRELEKEFGIEIDLFDALEITGVNAIITIIGNKVKRL